MAYANASDLPQPQSRLATFFDECRVFFALLGASVRVARAMEDSRQPDQQDLQLLGIKGPIPGTR